MPYRQMKVNNELFFLDIKDRPAPRMESQLQRKEMLRECDQSLTFSRTADCHVIHIIPVPDRKRWPVP